MTRQRVGEIVRDAATLASTHLATKLDHICDVVGPRSFHRDVFVDLYCSRRAASALMTRAAAVWSGPFTSR